MKHRFLPVLPAAILLAVMVAWLAGCSSQPEVADQGLPEMAGAQQETEVPAAATHAPQPTLTPTASATPPTVIEGEEATPVPADTTEATSMEITEAIIEATPTEIAGPTLTPEVSFVPARQWQLSMTLEHTGTISQTPGVDCGEVISFHNIITAEIGFEVLRRTIEGQGQGHYTPLSFCIGDPCQKERFECIGPIDPDTGEPGEERYDTLVFDALLGGEHTEEEFLLHFAPADPFVFTMGCQCVTCEGVGLFFDPGALTTGLVLFPKEFRLPRVENAVFEETGIEILESEEEEPEPEEPSCPLALQYHYRLVATPLE